MSRQGFSPPIRGEIPAATVAAMSMAGADEIYLLGGVQAIAAMTVGTETMEKVNLLAGRTSPAAALTYLRDSRSEFDKLATDAKSLRLIATLCLSAEQALERQRVEQRDAAIAEPVA